LKNPKPPAACDSGCTPSQISRIVNSPDFRKRYEAACEMGRRDAFVMGLTRPREG
jgi:hypothetical protein